MCFKKTNYNFFYFYEYQCHTMVEEYEDLVEKFWFNQFKKKRDADFFQWLCIENVKGINLIQI